MKLMVILVAAMMLCSYTFALSYGCSCGADSSSAYSSGDDPEASSTSASFSYSQSTENFTGAGTYYAKTTNSSSK